MSIATKYSLPIFCSFLLLLPTILTANEQSKPVKILNEYRTPEDMARDKYRHPAETLTFFGLKPTHTVVEIWPDSGWYTQVIAPVLRSQGQYIAAQYPANSMSRYHSRAQAKFKNKFTNKFRRYGRIVVSQFEPPHYVHLAPQKAADVVLTFRNIHNWMSSNQQHNVFKAAFAALKPGGVLGIVEHRAEPGISFSRMIDTGYVSEAYVKKLAMAAGFDFVSSSEINANPKDTKNYINGVWALPPTLINGDRSKAKYLKIGESDRMTLKFVKPE
ncbi:methyltransferase [Shewanella sp. OPT22]|nr:methyltransferase [Shewanella sp. OPT22]